MLLVVAVSARTPTGCLTLDKATGGGYPKGRIVEVRRQAAAQQHVQQEWQWQVIPHHAAQHWLVY